MTFSIDNTKPGNCPWPIYPGSAEVGQEFTAIDAVTQGTVVQTGVTTASITEDIIVGPDSPWDNVELPVATPDADARFASFHGVVTNEDAVAAGARCRVSFGPCTVQARVFDGAATSWAVGQVLVADTSGRLVAPGATGDQTKVCAVIARAYTGLTAGENLLWVHFSGIFPFGAVNTIA